jgi:hypothetical protein
LNSLTKTSVDLAAVLDGDYASALALVETYAMDMKAGTAKVANWSETLKGLGGQANDWVNKQVGAVARSGAANHIGNWWRDASSDPAKLGLIGAGAGLGLGGIGSMAFGQPGRRRPLNSMLLGGLMGGAALGGYGLMRNWDPTKNTLNETAGQRTKELGAAKEKLQQAQMTANPMQVGKGVGLHASDAVQKAVDGDLKGAVTSGKDAIQSADVLGLGELVDTSGKNNDLSPVGLLNDSTRKGLNLVERSGVLSKGEGNNLADSIKLPQVNPALEGIAGLGMADAALSARSNSLRRPDYLRKGLGTPDGAATLNRVTDGQGQAATRQLLGTRDHRGVLGSLIGDAKPDLKTSLGARLPWRGSGFNFTPPAPAGGGAAPAPMHIGADQLRTIAGKGRAEIIAESGDPRGFLRSGFGSAAGGRVGGIGLPRGVVYGAVPATLNWFRTRPQATQEAQQGLANAQQASDAAQNSLGAHNLLKNKPLTNGLGALGGGLPIGGAATAASAPGS